MQQHFRKFPSVDLSHRSNALYSPLIEVPISQKLVYLKPLKQLLGFVFLKRSSCVFVLSTGRCGTKTLAYLLDGFAKINCLHEPHPKFLELGRACLKYEKRTKKDRKEVAKSYAGSRVRVLMKNYFSNTWYGETSNRLTGMAYALSEVSPNSRFIHLYRHPGAFVRSGFRRKLYERSPEHYPLTPSGNEAENWEEWTPFRKTCWYWAKVNEFALEFNEYIGSSRCLSMSSEVLFSDTVKQSKRIGLWLSIPDIDANKAATISGAHLNKQITGAFPEWQDWDDEHKRILKDMCGNTAKKLGYAL